MDVEGRKRVVTENVSPEIDGGRFPIKRVINQKVIVRADVFADGHDVVVAALLFKKADNAWQSVPMQFLGNDRWEGSFTVDEMVPYAYTVEGWVDRFLTWHKDIQKKYKAGQDIKVDLLIGIQFVEDTLERAKGQDAKRLKDVLQSLQRQGDVKKFMSIITSPEFINLMNAYPDKGVSTIYEKELRVIVERREALFSAWYELFPRSCASSGGGHGTFVDCINYLPEIVRMGFDVLYLPPIHSVGKTNRKGKNNNTAAHTSDPGSPWAIGSQQGGHDSIEPLLGTMEDFKKLVEEAKKFNIEIAMDIAFQCSPDHPYIEEHPEWFKKRPDGSIQFAENPPKKYEDIVPFHFESEQWQELWEELKNVVLFWIDKGVRIFRVDNPHTKPFAFWQWLIREVRSDYPEVIFLSEAFTRPKVMYRLAKVGFSQSYTYFTWRNTKNELTHYLNELTTNEAKEYFRPNFWPNTPDILPEFLQYGGRPAFIIRLVLAATLSSNYGIYGPAFELCVSEALQGREEYLNAEKYEIKHWNRKHEESLNDIIARVNQIRKENPALQDTWNLKFYEIDNDDIIAYGKTTEDYSDIIIAVVNLDPFHTQSGWLRVPLDELGIEADRPYLAHDLLGGDKYIWNGERNYIQLDPSVMPAHILRIRRRMRSEVDFDYFM